MIFLQLMLTLRHDQPIQQGLSAVKAWPADHLVGQVLGLHTDWHPQWLCLLKLTHIDIYKVVQQSRYEKKIWAIIQNISRVVYF